MFKLFLIWVWTIIGGVPGIGIMSKTREVAGAGVMLLGEQVKNSVKTQGFLLFLFSTIIFIYSKIYGIDQFYIWASLFFMIFAAFFVFKGKGSWIVMVFFLWYIVFGRSDIASLPYWFIPLTVIGVVVKGLYAKFKKHESFTGGIGNEGFLGAMLILIFFIDVGLIEFFQSELDIILPGIVHGLLIWIPLWAYVGVFVMMQDDEKSALAKFCGFVSIVYLVVVVVTIAPQVYGEEVLPRPEELLTEKQINQKIYAECQFLKFGGVLSCIGEPSYNDCMNKEDRYNKCIAEKRCKTIELHSDEEGEVLKGKALDECIKNEIKRLKKSKTVGGTIDNDLKPTKVKFESKNFQKEVIYSDKLNLIIKMIVENPRKMDLKAKASCMFKKGKVNVTGEVKDFKFSRVGEVDSTSLSCKPTKELGEGSWQVEYKILFEELSTFSRLYRAFIGSDKSPQWVEDEVPQILITHFTGNEKVAKAPADLARIYFAFGNPLDHPVLSTAEGVLLAVKIENGYSKGKIAKIREFDIDIPSFGVDSDCISRKDVPLTDKSAKQTVFLDPCDIKSFPVDLANPIDYEYRQFKATMVYDYEVTFKINTKILEK